MEKLEKLTDSQLEKMNEVKQFWLDYIFSCKNSLDRTKASIQIEWLYKFFGRDKPIIIYVDSPLACQYATQYVKALFKTLPTQVWDQVGDQVGDQVWDQVGDQVWDQVWDQVRDQVGDQVGGQVRDQVRDQVGDQVGGQVRDQVRDQVWDQVGGQVWDQVRDQVRDQVGDQVGDQVRDQVWDQVGDQVGDQVWDQVYEPFAIYGSVADFGWVSFYDFFTQIGVINHEGFNQFKSLLSSGIYDMIQLNGFCIVSDLPKQIKRNNRNRLHNENGPSIQFKDGYELYYWNGVSVPKEWIINKDSISRSTIASEKNAEKRRCLREIVGASKYYELVGGVNLIDEDIDNQGNPMRLYQTKTPDEIINKHIQFLEVICPSTQRMYNLYPTRHDCKNVWEAKASTFKDQKGQYRHGDVMLLNLNKTFDKPLIET